MQEQEAVQWLQDACVALSRQLLDAAAAGDTGLVHILLQKGASVNWADEVGLVSHPNQPPPSRVMRIGRCRMESQLFTRLHSQQTLTLRSACFS